MIPCQHGRGIIGKLMAHGFGYFIRFKNEPSLYIAGDTILTKEVKDFIQTEKPDVTVLPAGGARFDLGAEIIMGLNEAIEVASLTQGKIIANHLEALDHCPTTRKELKDAVNNNGLSKRFFVPDDGESLSLSS